MKIENSEPKVLAKEANPFGDIARLVARKAREAKVQAVAQTALQRHADMHALVDHAKHIEG